MVAFPISCEVLLTALVSSPLAATALVESREVPHLGRARKPVASFRGFAPNKAGNCEPLGDVLCSALRSAGAPEACRALRAAATRSPCRGGDL